LPNVFQNGSSSTKEAAPPKEPELELFLEEPEPCQTGPELPPGHGSHVLMEGDQSLAHARCCTDISTDMVGAVPETGSLEGDGSRGPLELAVGHVASSSSATGPDYLHLKSAEGFIQPDTGTYEVGNPVLPPLAPQRRRSQRPNSP